MFTQQVYSEFIPHPGDAPGEETNSVARRLSPIKRDNDRPPGS